MKACKINGSTLKIIAVISMVFDHFGTVVLKNGIIMHATPEEIPDTVFEGILQAVDVCNIIGRIAFPVFCFLLTEGFIHSRNVQKYIRNLLLFAIITEPIYNLAFGGKLCYSEQQNVLFELLLGLIVLLIISRIDHPPTILKWLIGIVLILAAGYVSEWLCFDGGLYGVLLIVVFYYCRNLRKIKFVAAVLAIMIGSCHLIGGGFAFGLYNCFNWHVLFAVIALILISMYNGKRGMKLKYFFYCFYPGHLAILAVIGVVASLSYAATGFVSL